MTLLEITITARAPLAFAEHRPGEQYRASLPFVPGATIYGALGATCYTPERFATLRCHNAYPAHPQDGWVRPLPLTAIRPKGTPIGDCEDSLVRRVCWERQQPPALVYGPTDDTGRPWEAAGRAFYTLGEEKPVQRQTSQRVLTRVAINRQRGTAEEGRLYSPLVLNEVTFDDKKDAVKGRPTTFRGSVVIADDDKQAHEALLAISHLGGRQSSGLGAVDVTVATNAGTADDGAAIKERVEQLTDRFRAQAARYERLGGEPWAIKERTIFTVNLLSDAFLLKENWLPSTTLGAEVLRELGIEVRLLRAFSTSGIVGGWNVSWQRPKPVAVATRMGSLFVFAASESLSDAQCAALAALQLDGVGDRRAEGHGQIRVCDAFHLQEVRGGTVAGG